MLSSTTSQFSIPTQSLDSITALNFTFATELMQNYAVGSPVNPTQHVAAIRSPNDTPVVFSIGTDNGCYAIFNDSSSPSGWNQVDLRQGLHAAFPDIDPGAQTYTMAVSQDKGGTFRIAVALAGQGTPVFFVSRDATLPPAVSADFWASSLQWVRRPGLDQVIDPSALPSAIPTNLLLSTGDDGNGSPTMIAVLKVNNIAQRFFVNINFTDSSWSWVAYEITQNIQNVDDVIFGIIPLRKGGVRGTFLLGHNANNQRALYFTSLPNNVLKQTNQLQFVFALPPNAAAIAALPGQIPNAPAAYGTDLYVGGDGLYVFKAADLGYLGSKAQFRTILDATAAPGVQAIVGSLGGSNVSLWFTTEDAQDDLAVVRGTNAYADAGWTAPATLFSDVLQIAASRDSQGQAEDVIMVGGDNQLRYLYQDQTTTLWATHDIVVQSTGTTVDFTGYQVKLAIKTDSDDPFTQSDQLFSVSSSQWGYITVNGTMYLSSPDYPVSVAPDEHGTLTITQPVTSASTPIFHISAPFLTTGFDLHPAGVLNQQLNAMTSAKLLGATYMFGGSAGNSGAQVLQNPYNNPAQVQGGAQALQNTTNMSLQGVSSSVQAIPNQTGVYLNNTGRPANQIDQTALQQQNPGQPYAWGLVGDAEQWAFKTGQDALDIVEQLGETIKWFFGDLWHHIHELGSSPQTFLVQLVGDTLKLFVKLEAIVIEVELFVLEHALTALSWLLKDIFGIDISGLVQWLGFLFEFQYYQYTQQFIDNTISNLLGQAENGVAEMKQYFVGMLDNAESYLRSIEPITHDAGNASTVSAYNQYVKPAAEIAEFLICNPVGSWIMEKFTQAFGALLGDGSTGPDWETELVTNVYAAWKTLFTSELDNLLSMVSDFVDDINKLANGNLSMNGFIAELSVDVAIHIIESVKDLLIAAFDVMADFIDGVRDGLMKEGIEIPIISTIYHLFTGNDPHIKLFQIVEFVLAVPATAITFFATGKYPFTSSNPPAPPFTLDFSGQLPPATQATTNAQVAADIGAGLAQIRTQMLAAAGGDGSGNERSTVNPVASWVLASGYSTSRLLDVIADVIVAGMEGKGADNFNVPVMAIKIVQMLFKIMEAALGGGPGIALADNNTVKNLKIFILVSDLVKGLCNCVGAFAGAKTGSGGERKPLVQDVPDEELETLESYAVIGEIGLTVLGLGLEIWAIVKEWGTNSAADDGMLVTQQACEYIAEFVALGTEVAKVKGEAQFWIGVGVGVTNTAALAFNLARTGLDAEHHRNF